MTDESIDPGLDELSVVLRIGQGGEALAKVCEGREHEPAASKHQQHSRWARQLSQPASPRRHPCYGTRTEPDQHEQDHLHNDVPLATSALPPRRLSDWLQAGHIAQLPKKTASRS